QWACVSGLDGLGAGHASGEPQSLDRTGASARPPRPGRIGEPQESAHSHHPAGDHNPSGGAAADLTSVIGQFTTTDASADQAGPALAASGDKSSIQATSIRSASITTVPPADPPSDPSASAPPFAAHAFYAVAPGSQHKLPTLQWAWPPPTVSWFDFGMQKGLDKGVMNAHAAARQAPCKGLSLCLAMLLCSVWASATA